MIEKQDKQDKQELILGGNMYRVLLTLSIPIMINSIIQTLYNLVDGVYVSEISSVHFAATSFVWPINFFFISIGLGLSVAGTSILSQILGKGRWEKAGDYASQLMVFTALFSLVFALIGYLITPRIVYLMGARGEFYEYSKSYLRITFFDLPFMFIFFNINSIMTSQGDTVTPTVLSGISALINIVLDPIFIFDFGWGIEGAAYATLLSKVVLALVGFIFLFFEKNKIRLNFRNFRFKKDIIKEIVNIGIPASIGQSGSAIGFMVLNFFIASYGTSTMAAFGMVNRITGLIMQPAMGIGTALTAVVGQNLGADNLARVKESFKKAMVLTTIVGGLGGIILILFNKEIIYFFMRSRDDMEVIQQSIIYLIYISLSMPFMGIFSVFSGLFQGTGHTKYSMIMEIGRLWIIRLPMILIFREFTSIGSEGIWFSMSFSNVVVCIYGYLIYKSGKWERKVLKSE